MTLRGIEPGALVIGAILLVAWLRAWPTASAGPAAHEGHDPCGATTLQIEQGGDVIFQLPSQQGERLRLDPEMPVTVRVRNIPASGRVDVKAGLPFGQSLARSFSWEGQPPGSDYVTTVDLTGASDLGGLLRGAYDVEVTMTVPDQEPCEVGAQVQVGSGISGTVPTSIVWAAIASAAASVGIAGWTGVRATRPQVGAAAGHRRRARPRPQQLRLRALALPAVTGALAGAITSMALQQAGAATLTTGLLVLGVIAGAVVAAAVTILAFAAARSLGSR
ncbi:MAG: hypothetical protein HY682_03195 [Chloroflexi bacterium]|nr:hypothetical protein [Chloroflexota bacterium]